MTKQEVLGRMNALLEMVENLRQDAEHLTANSKYFFGKEYAYSTVCTMLQEEITGLKEETK